MPAFLSFCHPDYLGDMADALTDRARALAAPGWRFGGQITTSGEAYREARRVLSEDADGVVLFLAGWVECSVVMTAVRELRNLPICLLGVPMFDYQGRRESTGSYVSWAMFKGVLDRLGYRYSGALGDLGSEEVKGTLADFSAAAHAAKSLSRATVGLVGYTSMSIYTGTFDHMFLRDRIGVEVEHMDAFTLIERAKKIPAGRVEEERSRLSACAKIAENIDGTALSRTLALAAAISDLSAEHGWTGVNVKCQYEFSKEYRTVPCVALSLLASKDFVASCEGDVLNTVSMAMLTELSGAVAGYGDAISHTGDTVTLSSCGFLPLGMGEGAVGNFMPHPGFSGVQCSFCPRPGRVTAMRLIEDRCDYHVLCFEGEGRKTPLRQGYMPALDIKLDGSVEALVRQYAGQHFAFAPGNHASRIEALCRALGIGFVRV